MPTATEIAAFIDGWNAHKNKDAGLEKNKPCVVEMMPGQSVLLQNVSTEKLMLVTLNHDGSLSWDASVVGGRAEGIPKQSSTEGVVKAAIVDMDTVYEWKVPFGSFHLEGKWDHNPNLSMTAKAQRKHNESIGVWPIAEQVTAWPDANSQNGSAEHE